MSKLATPHSQVERHNRSRHSSTKKGDLEDLWEENIHFAKAHDEPGTAERLQSNMRLVGNHDKFVEYIRHVESKLDDSRPSRSCLTSEFVD